MHSPIEALENAAEFGIGGAMPVFADDPHAGGRSRTLLAVTGDAAVPNRPIDWRRASS